MNATTTIGSVPNIDIFGRKTFLIAADKALIGDRTLESLCAEGYEVYSVSNDNVHSVRQKVSVISKKFPQSIFYFNVDVKVSGIDWIPYIESLHNDPANTCLYGIMYRALNKSEKENKEAAFSNLSTLRSSVPDLALLSKESENTSNFLSILTKIKARGRREHIRVSCTPSSTLKIDYNNTPYTARMVDINAIHFKCVLNKDIGIKIFDKIRDARLTMNDFSFKSDIVLIMKRNKESEYNYIFMFIHDREHDTPDLDDKSKLLLNQSIYKVLSDNMASVLHTALITS